MIGKRIRDYREGKGLKVAAFASIIGISQGSLSDIENGKTKPSADTLSRIVRNTDIDPGWLLTGELIDRAAETQSQYTPISDQHIIEVTSIMALLDTSAKEDILRQARKEFALLQLKKNNQVQSELIDALEPRTFERQRKLKPKTEPSAEKREKNIISPFRPGKKPLT
jgi:transcriptional regulator with XRE-family HTH domain